MIAGAPPIRPCTAADFDAVWETINDGAEAYRGVIPADRWHEPYMGRAELQAEIDAGVRFFAALDGDAIVGVMGIQDVPGDRGPAAGWPDVTLIRHAYVRTAARRGGIGGALLHHLMGLERGPLLIGTWAAADWAVRFYEKHGFRAVGRDEARRLLRQYWTVPARQIETSVVLAEAGFAAPAGAET